jgi:hypothetical protein
MQQRGAPHRSDEPDQLEVPPGGASLLMMLGPRSKEGLRSVRMMGRRARDRYRPALQAAILHRRKRRHRMMSTCPSLCAPLAQLTNRIVPSQSRRARCVTSSAGPPALNRRSPERAAGRSIKGAKVAWLERILPLWHQTAAPQ